MGCDSVLNKIIQSFIKGGLCFCLTGFVSFFAKAGSLAARPSDQDGVQKMAWVFDGKGRNGQREVLSQFDPVNLTAVNAVPSSAMVATKSQPARPERTPSSAKKILVSGAVVGGSAGLLAAGSLAFPTLLTVLGYVGAAGMFALAGLALYRFFEPPPPSTGGNLLEILLNAAVEATFLASLPFYAGISAGLGILALLFPASWAIAALATVGALGVVAMLAFIDEAARQ